MTQKQLHALVTAILFARRTPTAAASPDVLERDVDTAGRIIKLVFRTDTPGSVV